MITPVNMLAGSGILAGGALIWNHIKSIYTRVSGLAIERVHMNAFIETVIFVYFRAKYKRLPSVINYIDSTSMSLRNGSYTTVPFIRTEYSSFFMVNKNLVLLDGKCNISFIRGTVDIKKLINDALYYYENDFQINNNNNIRPNRFCIMKKIGREKNYPIKSSSQEDENDSVGIRKNPQGHDPAGENNYMPLNMIFDESFRYKREEYLYNEEEDIFKGLYFSQEMMLHVDDAVKWLEKKDWYAERCLSWCKGWLLTGPGGTGKSSFIKCIGKTLGLPVNIFYLDTMSNQEFMNFWDEMSRPCIIVFEDFDSLFKLRQPLSQNNSLTFDCILNAISGIEDSFGRFLIVTANNIENIDPAMGIESDKGNGVSTRPGRLDRVIHFGNMNFENRMKLAKKVLSDWPDIIPGIVNDYNDVTPAQFKEICGQAAFAKMREEDNNVIKLASD